MKDVRVWFTKDKEARYISHLDLNRTMLRAITHANIPVWHTEGFNQHPFITFALPLSLGFRGAKETMDTKLIDDISEQEIVKRLNASLPQGIRIYKVTEPVMKPGKISYAQFDIKLTSDDVTLEELYGMVNNLFALDEIMVEKKSKKGIKEVDLKEHFCKYTIKKELNDVSINIVLPAGSTENLNPSLIIKALEKLNEIEVFQDITRLDIFNENVESFE
ncbi:radical SAM protein [Clostridia bacterium]|nr:radical SAM protein [Clostridia bacterium]